ncbi:MAG: hypothetical protein QF535_21830, partial [Anaerolineales bacterium]|nr:hypothetical protein [Anaerolineales bacterium]
MILSLVMVMGILLVSAVMFRFLLGFMAVAGGKTGGKVCARTIEYKIGWDNDIDGMEDSATLDRPGFGDGMIINWWMDDPVGSVNDGIASVSTTLRGSVQPVCNKYTTKCKGTADEVARCLHARAADTYYSLAGYSYGDASVKTAQEMTLLEIETQVTAPGNITLRGGCDEYITDYQNLPADSMTICTNRDKFKVGDDKSRVDWLEPCGQEIETLMGDTYCSISFGTVDGHAITLTGMYDCSRTAKGLESISCLCYPKAGKKNNIGNGIRWKGRKEMNLEVSSVSGEEVGSKNNANLKGTWTRLPGSDTDNLYGVGNNDLYGCAAEPNAIYSSKTWTLRKTPQTAWWEGSVFPNINDNQEIPAYLYSRLYTQEGKGEYNYLNC